MGEGVETSGGGLRSHDWMVTCVDGQRQAVRFEFRAQAPYWGYMENTMETTIMGYIGVILGLYGK